MKNFMKKISKSRLFAVVLVIVLIASVATVAMAAEEETGDTKGVEKGTYDTNYTVTTVKSVKSGSVVVGAYLNYSPDEKGLALRYYNHALRVIRMQAEEDDL